MIHFVLAKLKNKGGLNLALFVGLTLLVGVFTAHPMFEKGADNQLLSTAFSGQAETDGRFPAVLVRQEEFSGEELPTAEKLYADADAYEQKWLEYLKLPVVARQQYYRLPKNSADSSITGKSHMLELTLMRELSEHAAVTHGEELSADSDDFGCLITEKLMDDYGLVVGEELHFPFLQDADGKEITLVIRGIIAMKDPEDPFWYQEPETFDRAVFVTEAAFAQVLASGSPGQVSAEDDLLLDYTKITWKNADAVADYLAQFAALDSHFSTGMSRLLARYQKDSRSVALLMWVLELPCIVLLMMFLYMTAERIAAAEEGEIASLVSRGITRRQILGTYFLQTLLLGLLGLAVGILLGAGLCLMGSGTDAFLHFTGELSGDYRMNLWMLPYGLAACLISAVIMLIPVRRRSRQTIVERSGRTVLLRKPPFWERYFCDVLLLLLSVYLFYNYNHQKELLAQQALRTAVPDPLVFLNVMLFVFAAGLFTVRLIRYLVLLVQRLGRKRWSPGIYASFLQIGRTFYRQSLIVILLIMTIAEGMFDAGMARTVNENSSLRISYNIGCDIRVNQIWERAEYYRSGQKVTQFGEPDYEVYSGMIRDGLCEQTTRVIADRRASANFEKGQETNCLLLAIHTREFGETADFTDNVNPQHWFYALNALAENIDGAIISRNLAEKYDLAVGSTFQYARSGESSEDEEGASGNAKTTGVKVCAIVDAFPGYERYRYTTSTSGEIKESERGLIVVNYAQEVGRNGLSPYEVWVHLSSPSAEAEVLQRLEEAGAGEYERTVRQELLRENRSSAVIRITNGLFTIAFLVSLLACCVGLFVYQLMSMESRKPLFGIYRAMGMHMKELAGMLWHEQLFGVVPAILAGLGVGLCTMRLFVPLLAVVYLPRKHNLPLEIRVTATDIAGLFAVVLLVVAACFVMLRMRLAHLRVADALKMGEDS